MKPRNFKNTNDSRRIIERIEARIERIPDPMFVNVGSFDGRDSVRICQLAPGATCHAIEACPTNFKIVTANTKDHKQIHCHHLAISDQDGEARFYTANNKKSTGTSQANSLYNNFLDEKDWAKTTEVVIDSLTLDNFCTRNNINHIDLLKLNCEGCEYAVFEAPELQFLSFTDMISLQIHGKSSEFCSGGFRAKRRMIMDMIAASGMRLAIGVTVEQALNSVKHARQLWVR